ncbi:serine hydrolase [Microbacterium sp. Root166]|uniref:serine hydrolase domain-containing protein n=1 Tax=Microbacterium sp. Root166 TaxID=1736478 RepID=UPI0006F397BC|nr:serine hydrolase domain-containing protein [Microbacterium sp. Root166]KQZ84071.1 serine hydrolase [Microbacterium sp. Root166]
MDEFVPDLDDFSGVLSVRRGTDVLGEWATGIADRTAGVANTPETRFGLASGTKTFTAVSLLSLVADGSLSLQTRAREVLGDDLPLVADDVTIDHLLTHTSGIGDYLDEEVDALAPLSVPAQQLDSTPAYLAMLDGFPTKFAAGERFSYCNGGYVVLAVIAERVSGVPFADLVARRVFGPAGMAASGFFRSDLLPPGTAVGYLDDGRSNVFALPVLGSGDGGAYSTGADLHRFWLGLVAGRMLPPELVALAIQPVTPDADEGMGYGRGIWLEGDHLLLAGGDHGVTVVSRHDPVTGTTSSALANRGAPTFARARKAMEAALAGGIVGAPS